MNELANHSIKSIGASRRLRGLLR